MDATLFDYKNGQQDPQRKNNIKPPQRPISSHQNKPVYNPGYSNHAENQQGALPPVAGIGRMRPNTAIIQQGTNSSIEGTRSSVNPAIQALESEEEARILEKNAYEEPQQMPDIQKLMPKNIKVEKEKLYEDTLHLKQNNNILREENMKLKTKNLTLERDNARLMKTVESMGNTGSQSTQYGKPGESALIAALKKQTKEAKDELKMKIDELQTVKRNIKFTKMQELEAELKANIDENIRMRHVMEELAKAKPQIKPEDYHKLEERFYMQTNMLENYQRELMRQNGDIKYLEEQNFNLQAAREQDIRNAQKQQNELAKMKRQLRDKDQRFSVNKLDLSGHKVGKSGGKIEDDLSEMRAQLEQRDQALSQRDKTIEDLKQKLNEKLGNEMKEKQHYNIENMKIKEQYAELEARYRMLLSMHYANEQQRKLEDSPTSRKEEELMAQGLSLEENELKVKKVSFEDVKAIGNELSLKLKIRCVPLEDVLNSLDKFGNLISLTDMKTILAYDPFGLKDENNSLLVARYVIEPQDEEITTLDIGRIQALDTIKDRVKTLLGSYTLINADEARQMNQEITEIISEHGEKLNNKLNELPESKTGYLSLEQITKVFKELGVQIDSKIYDFLVMNLYEYTGNLKRLDYMKMFEIFRGNRRNTVKTASSHQNVPNSGPVKTEEKAKAKESETENKEEKKSKTAVENKEEDQEVDEDFEEEGIYEDEYDDEGDASDKQ